MAVVEVIVTPIIGDFSKHFDSDEMRFIEVTFYILRAGEPRLDVLIEPDRRRMGGGEFAVHIYDKEFVRRMLTRWR